MRCTLLLIAIATIFSSACNNDPFNSLHTEIAGSLKKVSIEIPPTIASIPKPDGFKAMEVYTASFGNWIRNLPLRKDNILRLYDGRIKPDQRLHYAILDVPYNHNVLQQCADAVMRLYAEYIYATKSSPVISFLHQGNKYFTISSRCSRPELEAFLNNVFNWCGTYNLQQQLKPVHNFNDITPGDVLVKAGSPGHAMLVADVAVNEKGEKMFLLLQSFMPAQEIHIVINPYYPGISPWYNANYSVFRTPGWLFTRSDLRRW